jgi:hypothetical protein
MSTLTFAGPVYKIQFKFRRRDIPPNFDVDHLGKLPECKVNPYSN